MKRNYVFPNVLMSQEDTDTIADLETDISQLINEKKADWIMNGFTDADWEQYLSDLDAYGLAEYLEVYQKYLDDYYSDIDAAEQ